MERVEEDGRGEKRMEEERKRWKRIVEDGRMNIKVISLIHDAAR